jgi:hypothetical protein
VPVYVVVAPLRWRLRPSYFELAANRIATLAGPELAKPAETLHRDISGLWLRTHQGHIARAVGLAEAVPARPRRPLLSTLTKDGLTRS